MSGQKINNPYVIECDGKFVGHDAGSGGYPYWAGHLRGATYYTDVDAVMKELASSEFTRPRKMSDGTVYPPSMIHSALGLNNEKESGEGVLKICKIELVDVYNQKISGSLGREAHVEAKITKEEEETLKALREGRAKVIHV